MYMICAPDTKVLLDLKIIEDKDKVKVCTCSSSR